MKFGEKLNELRNEKEMTQPDMVEAIGIEQSYLSKLEHEERAQFMNSIRDRVDEEYHLVSDIRGNIYNVAVPGGSRTYYLQGDTEIDPWQSKLVVFVGVLMSIFGLIGLFLERKLSRYR